MKKKFFILTSVMMLIFINVGLICYATGRGTYENNQNTDGAVVLDTVTSTVSMDFLSENNIELNYSKSYISGEKIKNVYLDNDDNEYILCNNECVGFIKKFSEEASLYNNIILDESVLEARAYDFMREVIIDDNRLDEYVLTSNGYVESYDEYVYTFTKKVSGYRTNDFICISLDPYGNLSSFCGSRQGDFDSIYEIDICQDEVDKFIENSVYDKYGNVQYTISSYFVNKIDNRFAMQYYVDIYNAEGDYNGDIVIYYLD